MYNLEYLEKIPNIEMSFQDDFAGNNREFTLTPKYIIREFSKKDIYLKIGNNILLWEIDGDIGDNEYYLCHIGKLVEFDKINIENAIPKEELVTLDGKAVFVQIDDNDYFHLPYSASFLKDKNASNNVR